jgi:Flp pilus assembly protein TadD
VTRRRLLFLLASLLVAFAVAIGLRFWSGRRPPRVRGGAAVPIVPEVADRARAGKPVIFVGLDGADWELLDEYATSGAMPNLASLVAEGTGGVLETVQPPLSPLVWTTMMTGVSPRVHGILDFTRFTPRSGQKEPITSDERREPAVWNMASAAGRRVGVLGLWATYPAEPVSGLLVSDRLFSFLYQEKDPPAGVVYPASEDARARALLQRVEGQVGLAELQAYLPWLDEAEYGRHLDSEDPYGHPVSALRRILVETRVYDELGREFLERERPDLLIAYFQGTDSVGHVFAPYAPPRQPAIPEQDYERYHSVPRAYFQAVDALLGRYRQLAQARGAVLMIASDHGFTWREGRPTKLSSFAVATAAKWHRKEGVYLLWGPGVTAEPGHRQRGKAAQVCATLLSLLGLPSAGYLAGPPLPGAPPASAARVDYRAFYRPSSLALAADPRADAEALTKLKALGYIGSGEADTSPDSARSTRTAGSYNNEGLVLKDEGKTDDARAAFEKALERDPNLASALWNLSDLLFAGGKELDRADELLLRAFARELPEGTRFLVGRAIGYQRSGDAARSRKLLEAGLAARPQEPELWLFRGRYRVDSGDCRGALADFERAAQLSPDDPKAFASEGLARLCLGDRDGARRSFERSLRLDPEQPKLREYLARP